MLHVSMDSGLCFLVALAFAAVVVVSVIQLLR